MNFSLVKENIIDQGRRVLKVFEFGAKTADVATSFGDDSAPLKDMVAIYARTSEGGDSVIVGYINKHQIAQDGEKRIFSLKPDGSLSFDIHLKGDGTCEIGGSSDNAVRYLKLDESIQNQTQLINGELIKIASAINTLAPGSYVPTPIVVDLSQAKIDKIKVL